MEQPVGQRSSLNVDITLPQLGESVTEGTIVRWHKSIGEPVEINEVVAEIATDKVDADLPSPVAGVVVAIRVPEGATVPVGAVLAVVDGSTPAVPSPPPPETTTRPPPQDTDGRAHSGSLMPPPQSPPPQAPPPQAAHSGMTPSASPLARRILREAGLPLAGVKGSGRLDRITRADAERAVGARRLAEDESLSAVVSTPAPPPPTTSHPEQTSPGPSSDAGRHTRVPMSRIRQRTAAHMVRSRATSAHALVAVEVRYDAVERVRLRHREAFRTEEGRSLTFLPFIARATVDALRRFPQVNASIVESASTPASETNHGTGKVTGLALHSAINLGVAVDLGFAGLVAPVVRHADDYRLRAIARRIGEVADRARDKTLQPDDFAGGTFTITNSGSYGTHLVIPIINQPQVAILSTDGVRRQPVVAPTAGGEAIGIGSVGVLALSWDQRAFDGAYAAAFLDEVRTILENRDWETELQ